MLSLGGQDVSRISALFAMVSESGLVWQLGDDDGRDASRMERAGDLSPNGAFGRCLVYRIDITQLSQVELCAYIFLKIKYYIVLFNFLCCIILYYI